MSDVLQLSNFRLVRLKIDSEPFAVLPANPDFRQETGYDVLINKDDPNAFLMILRISGCLASPGSTEDAGTKLEVHAVGEFRVPDGLDDGKKDYLVRYNGGMILYGMVRGQVAMATGAFPCGSLLLPTLYWQATVKEIESKRSAQDTAGSRLATESGTSPQLESSKPAKAPATPAKKPKKATKQG